MKTVQTDVSLERILISVIIPSYNRANTVGFTIDSILAQKVDADIEIVIGDDCSTDNAREVLLQYFVLLSSVNLLIRLCLNQLQQ